MNTSTPEQIATIWKERDRKQLHARVEHFKKVEKLIERFPDLAPHYSKRETAYESALIKDLVDDADTYPSDGHSGPYMVRPFVIIEGIKIYSTDTVIFTRAFSEDTHDYSDPDEEHQEHIVDFHPVLHDWEQRLKDAGYDKPKIVQVVKDFIKFENSQIKKYWDHIPYDEQENFLDSPDT